MNGLPYSLDYYSSHLLNPFQCLSRKHICSTDTRLHFTKATWASFKSVIIKDESIYQDTAFFSFHKYLPTHFTSAFLLHKCTILTSLLFENATFYITIHTQKYTPWNSNWILYTFFCISMTGFISRKIREEMKTLQCCKSERKKRYFRKLIAWPL